MEYEDFLRMVCEDYNISEVKAVEFAYMLPKCILKKMPNNTPPILLNTTYNMQALSHCSRQTENVGADFGSFGNVQYETMNPSQKTMKPSHEAMKPSLETMKPSQLRKSEAIKSGEIFSEKREELIKLRKLSMIERFDFSIKKS
ncbi:hypothetical protein F2Q68_00018838 [Brassica cretica]|uniref:Uncharacterized protein n=1 Tax=Brassica cretica TaxID=69181 RepID=A0A8S9FUP7_BRACR|nr:hypothetical protein F2Q68_00018838 [Brassica cretica]